MKTIKAKVFKLGSHAVTLCDVIHSEVDDDGCPQFALRMGEKVHISSVEPLMVRNLEGSSFVVDPEFIHAMKGRPVKILD